ncbi:hypothetical protein ZHAS_00022310 [Anopheles sinensis]|uniref:Uncharacterized protein n=1 Tax=Anopheles sinensis TaxID=74873 RepID=A0A084WUH3_ANOSI|nr:hypothetical protein ZHAS_00022310 [Anopheles sinensis]
MVPIVACLPGITPAAATTSYRNVAGWAENHHTTVRRRQRPEAATGRWPKEGSLVEVYQYGASAETIINHTQHIGAAWHQLARAYIHIVGSAPPPAKKKGPSVDGTLDG